VLAARPNSASATATWRSLVPATVHVDARPDFRDFAMASTLPAIAAGPVGSPTVNLFYDHLLVKEPGSDADARTTTRNSGRASAAVCPSGWR
jgi:hypothetical protein